MDHRELESRVKALNKTVTANEPPDTALRLLESLKKDAAPTEEMLRVRRRHTLRLTISLFLDACGRLLSLACAGLPTASQRLGSLSLQGGLVWRGHSLAVFDLGDGELWDSEHWIMVPSLSNLGPPRSSFALLIERLRAPARFDGFSG